MTDLLIRNAALVATVDADRRELAGGWVAVSDGLVSGVGSSTDPEPVAARMIDADGCLVTPGLVNTHHHLYQNLTRGLYTDDICPAVWVAAGVVPVVDRSDR